MQESHCHSEMPALNGTVGRGACAVPLCLSVYLCSEGGAFWEQAGISSPMQARACAKAAVGEPHIPVEPDSPIRAAALLGTVHHGPFPWRLSWKSSFSHVPGLSSRLVAERPAPPRELLVPQAEVTARSLRLQWVPGSDGASPIRYFTVQVRELPRGEWQTYSSSISHEATACEVERY